MASALVRGDGTVSSFKPMIHHERLSFQAALEILVTVPLAAQGICVAKSTFLSSGLRSCAKYKLIPLKDILAGPVGKGAMHQYDIFYSFDRCL